MNVIPIDRYFMNELYLKFEFTGEVGASVRYLQWRGG